MTWKGWVLTRKLGRWHCRQVDKFKLQDLVAALHALAVLGSTVDGGVAESATRLVNARASVLGASDQVNLLWCGLVNWLWFHPSHATAPQMQLARSSQLDHEGQGFLSLPILLGICSCVCSMHKRVAVSATAMVQTLEPLHQEFTMRVQGAGSE